ncbi:hypothetical protein PSA7680_00524 [Pseudoruegeria aquimaris]|uniref:Uncharacterized protein n=1 Tax=Pseudoruegeria aquimaris TaxID=393663 RepID=A0A1Y5RH08_9RHOB|nr:hypothetical protein [Pseudoruegeria aquimaris]SLN16970.1 hypothetical protein PSA7680_00524 [Pseudoruegeria aquimaris]
MHSFPRRAAVAALALCGLPLIPLMPLPALAAGDRSAELLELIRANGCEMTTAEADAILPEHGFTMDQTRGIVRQWVQDGLVDMRGFAGIKLSQKGCEG